MHNIPFTPLDLMNGPPLYRADIQTFTANQMGQGWLTWIKPKGISMVSMLAIAGGGGGGGGVTRAAASAGGGGGGGACSGIARLIIPAFLLPDVLYIQVGAGGLGGAAGASGSAGGNGGNTFISFGHSSATPNVLLASGVNAPGGGAGGTSAAAGTGGTVPTIATTVTSQSLGWWFATVGLVGAAGGAQTGAVGTTVTAWAALPLSPGAGGAGCTTTDFAGGAQTATAAVDFGALNFVSSAGGLAAAGTAAGTAVDGSAGVALLQPFYNCGGSGGGSNNSGTAGNGGKGGFGCGGGGGGTGTTGGRGGDGGNGLAILVSW